MVCERGRLYASAAGEGFCLDAATGSVRWRNRLPGMGLGIAATAVEGADGGPADGALVGPAGRQAQPRPPAAAR